MNTNKHALVAIGLLLGTAASTGAGAATVLTFVDNATPASPYPSTINGTSFAAGSEFRLVNPDGSLGGGPPSPHKDVMFGGETWSFDAAGAMSGTTGLPGNVGFFDASPVPGSAAPVPDTNPTIMQTFAALGGEGSILAPTTSSLAGAAYGPATINVDLVGGSIDVFFPILEQQWLGAWTRLGSADNDGDGFSDGVSFSGPVTNIVDLGGGVFGFDFALFAEETVDDLTPANGGGLNNLADEDPYDFGLADWSTQFEFHGTGTMAVVPVPVPAAFWLFGWGAVLLLGVARRPCRVLR